MSLSHLSQLGGDRCSSQARGDDQPPGDGAELWEAPAGWRSLLLLLLLSHIQQPLRKEETPQETCPTRFRIQSVYCDLHSEEKCSQLCNEILPLLFIECQQCNKEIYTSEVYKVKHFYT